MIKLDYNKMKYLRIQESGKPKDLRKSLMSFASSGNNSSRKMSLDKKGKPSFEDEINAEG